MNQPDVRLPVEITISPTKPPQSDLPERRLRRGCALLLLYLLLQAEFGLTWDRNWHDYLGRDQFWVPPHIMVYTGLGVAGIIALALVFIETYRYYHKKPGVDDSTTVRVFGFFAAPLGIIMLGFGTLVDFIAAPLDNYWHILYGIDVTLWSPFHLMGTIGSIFAGLGLLYILASEVVVARTSENIPRRWLGFNGPEWATLFLFALHLGLTFVALTTFKPVTIGPFSLVTYPVVLAFPASMGMNAVMQQMRKAGSATVVAVFVWIIAIFLQLFVWWALHAGSAVGNIPWRYDHEPVFNTAYLLLPLYYLLCALLVEAVFYWQNRKKTARAPLRGSWQISAAITLLATFVPTGIARFLHFVAPDLAFPGDVYQALMLDSTWPALLASLPLTLLISIGSAIIGSMLGKTWYRNRR